MSKLAAGARLSRALVALSTVSVAVHLFGLYRRSGPPSPAWFPHADKVEHLLGFGAPVFLILLARWCRPTGMRPVTRRFTLVVVGVFALHAVISELIQGFAYTSRTGDPADLLADWVGVLLGWLAAWLVMRRRPRPARGASSADSVRVPR